MVFQQVPVAGYYTSVEGAQASDRLVVLLESGEYFSFQYIPDEYNPRMVADSERSSTSAWESAREWCKKHAGDKGFKIWFKVYDPKWKTYQPQVGEPLTLIVANEGTSGMVYTIPDSRIASIDSVAITEESRFANTSSS